MGCMQVPRGSHVPPMPLAIAHSTRMTPAAISARRHDCPGLDQTVLYTKFTLSSVCSMGSASWRSSTIHFHTLGEHGHQPGLYHTGVAHTNNVHACRACGQTGLGKLRSMSLVALTPHWAPPEAAQGPRAGFPWAAMSLQCRWRLRTRPR